MPVRPAPAGRARRGPASSGRPTPGEQGWCVREAAPRFPAVCGATGRRALPGIVRRSRLEAGQVWRHVRAWATTCRWGCGERPSWPPSPPPRVLSRAELPPSRGWMKASQPPSCSTGSNLPQGESHDRAPAAGPNQPLTSRGEARRSPQNATRPLTRAWGASHGTKWPQSRSRNGPTWFGKTTAAMRSNSG